MNGFSKISKNILSWQWYCNDNVKSVYLHLLLKSAWTPMFYDDVSLNPGEIFIRQMDLMAELKKTRWQIRDALEKLSSSGAIEIIKTNTKGSHIKVNNFKDRRRYPTYNSATISPQFRHNSATANVDINNNKERYKKNNNKYKNNNIINKNINNYNTHIEEGDCYNNSIKELPEKHKYRCGIHL